MAKKKSSNRILYFLLGAVILIIIIVFALKKSGIANFGVPDPIKVELAEVKRKTIIEKVNASGTVQPVVEVKLSPDVAGEIIKLEVEEGDSVSKGDLLVEIRPDNFISALERAKANLSQQRANLEQSKGFCYPV